MGPYFIPFKNVISFEHKKGVVLKTIFPMKTKWKIDIFIFVLILGLGIFFWLGSYQGNAATVYPKSYGGNLSNDVLSALDCMQNNLETAQSIIVANSNQIQYIDQNGQIQNYQFYYDTVWDNDCPLISRVQDFRFEYRCANGYLITHVAKNLKHVETIGYTICVIQKEKEILANGRVKIYPKLTLSTVSGEDRIS